MNVAWSCRLSMVSMSVDTGAIMEIKGGYKATFNRRDAGCVTIVFDEKPVYDDGLNIVFGNPISSDLGRALDDENYSSVNGHFFIIRVPSSSDDKGPYFITDCCSGYKVLYTEVGGEIFITNSVKLLRTLRKLELDTSSPNFDYYRTHNFSCWKYTLFKDVYTVPAAMKTDLERFDSYVDFRVKNDNKEISDILKRTLDFLDGKIIVMFSGGIDSLLIAKSLISRGADVDLVFFRSMPSYQANLEDCGRAHESAKEMGLDLRIIDVRLDQYLLEGDFFDEMLLNWHFSLLHLGAFRAINEYYGPEVTVVNGQSADSILSLGPSNRNIQDFLRRLSFRPVLRFILMPFLPIINCLFGTRFCFTFGLNKYFCGVLDERRYFAFSSETKRAYSQFLQGVISEIQDSIGDADLEGTVKAIKLHSFLQGSDNQVVVKSAAHFGIKKVVMPFASSELIAWSRPLGFRELLVPKSACRMALQRFATEKQDASSNTVTPLTARRNENMDDKSSVSHAALKEKIRQKQLALLTAVEVHQSKSSDSITLL